MKSNKSFLKRLKITRTGKVLGRKPGKNHFNARATRRSQLNGKRMEAFVMSNKSKSRYLINS
jgi:ribosomal protein L35